MEVLSLHAQFSAMRGFGEGGSETRAWGDSGTGSCYDTQDVTHTSSSTSSPIHFEDHRMGKKRKPMKETRGKEKE